MVFDGLRHQILASAVMGRSRGWESDEQVNG